MAVLIRHSYLNVCTFSPPSYNIFYVSFLIFL